MNEDYIKALEDQIDHLQSKLAYAEPTVPFWHEQPINKLHHVYMSNDIVYATITVHKKNRFHVVWNSWNEPKSKVILELNSEVNTAEALQLAKKQVEKMIHIDKHIITLMNPLVSAI